jgi:hypothetical protein
MFPELPKQAALSVQAALFRQMWYSVPKKSVTLPGFFDSKEIGSSTWHPKSTTTPKKY